MRFQLQSPPIHLVLEGANLKNLNIARVEDRLPMLKYPDPGSSSRSDPEESLPRWFCVDSSEGLHGVLHLTAARGAKASFSGDAS